MNEYLVGVGDNLIEVAVHEVQTGVDTIDEDHTTDEEVLTGEGTARTDPKEPTKDKVNKILNQSCPGKPSVCSDHGTCLGRYCQCDTGV